MKRKWEREREPTIVRKRENENLAEIREEKGECLQENEEWIDREKEGEIVK